MHERVKKIRNYFKLSQAKFGEKIGVGQQAVGKIELGLTTLTERNFEAICRVFNVNPVWLRTGEGTMFDVSAKSELDVLCEKYNLSGIRRQIFEMYLELPPELQEIAAEYIYLTLDLTKRTYAVKAKQENRREQLLAQRDKIDAELATMDGGASDFAEESSNEAG